MLRHQFRPATVPRAPICANNDGAAAGAWTPVDVGAGKRYVAESVAGWKYSTSDRRCSAVTKCTPRSRVTRQNDLADRRTVVQRRGMVKCSYTLPVRQIYSELLTLIDLARVIYWPEHACERVRLLRRPTGANGMETAAEFAEYNIRILRCAGKYVSRT